MDINSGLLAVALYCYFLLAIMERYEIVKDIGFGNFGVAKLVRDRWTKELFAVKFIERGLKVCFIHIFLWSKN